MRALRYLLPLLGVLFAAGAYAFDPFVIKDIAVEGAQRTDAGTIYSYLPVKPGDTMTPEKATQSLHALYDTGFFKDVQLTTRPGGTLVVTVSERPSIASLDFDGIKEFKKEDLIKAMKDNGIAEGRILDRSTLERAEQEIKRQYVSRGRYSTEVKVTVTPLENNRVSIKFDVVEGQVSKIRRIAIIGNHVFRQRELLDQFELDTPNWISWYTKSDQYSKQKLSGDLEKLRSYYMDRGYLEFNIESTQVSITPDKKSIYITIVISEGPQYRVADIKLAGDLIIPEPEARNLIKINTGDIFSRALLTESSKAVSDRLANDGYAFANVNAVPDIDREKHLVSFTFYVDPGRRVYVRRVNIGGNTRTRDQVIRREVRQQEDSWYSAKQIELSKTRLNRLGYFEEVNEETPAVPGVPDQVDLNLDVKERSTGSISAGVGYGTGQGLILSGSIAQNNIFGTGNYTALQLNTSRLNTIESLSFTNPDWTPDGISRGYTLYHRSTNPRTLSLGDYHTDTSGANINFGVPLSEVDGLQLGVGYEYDDISTYTTQVCCDAAGDLVTTNISPTAVVNYVNEYGRYTSTIPVTVGWLHNSIDNALWPTKGTTINTSVEVGVPGGDIVYYRASGQFQSYFPLTDTFTFDVRGGIAYGAGLEGDKYPFTKYFYAGGPDSVRGFYPSSIGPHDVYGYPSGGDHQLTGGMDLLFPIPGIPAKEKSVRGSVFFDVGEVGFNYQLSQLRQAVGVGVLWSSPFGPIKVSFARPIKKEAEDRTQFFQFTFGQQF